MHTLNKKNNRYSLQALVGLSPQLCFFPVKTRFLILSSRFMHY